MSSSANRTCLRPCFIRSSKTNIPKDQRQHGHNRLLLTGDVLSYRSASSRITTSTNISRQTPAYPHHLAPPIWSLTRVFGPPSTSSPSHISSFRAITSRQSASTSNAKSTYSQVPRMLDLFYGILRRGTWWLVVPVGGSDWWESHGANC